MSKSRQAEAAARGQGGARPAPIARPIVPGGPIDPSLINTPQSEAIAKQKAAIKPRPQVGQAPAGAPQVQTPRKPLAFDLVQDIGGDGVIPQLPGPPAPAAPGSKRKPRYGLTVEALAEVCHETNRGYSIALGDRSHPVWDSASSWHKDSMIKGVEKVLAGEVRNPREAHESWMMSKLKSGWTYGDEHNPEAKTHPNLVPYGHLDDRNKLKDYLFTGIVFLLSEPA